MVTAAVISLAQRALKFAVRPASDQLPQTNIVNRAEVDNDAVTGSAQLFDSRTTASDGPVETNYCRRLSRDVAGLATAATERERERELCCMCVISRMANKDVAPSAPLHAAVMAGTDCETCWGTNSCRRV